MSLQAIVSAVAGVVGVLFLGSAWTMRKRRPDPAQAAFLEGEVVELPEPFEARRDGKRRPAVSASPASCA
jgi:hypothetical protein